MGKKEEAKYKVNYVINSAHNEKNIKLAQTNC